MEYLPEQSFRIHVHAVNFFYIVELGANERIKLCIHHWDRPLDE